MNKILKLSLIPFILICLIFISINFISTINAQEFEFNEEDYFSFEEDEGDGEGEGKDATTTNSEDVSATTNAEDTDDKETCINNQIESVLSSNGNMNSDSYSSDFHFIKKFDKEGNLISSFGTVGSQDGQFLHAHGITIDSEDNVYVSDAENCNIQKFDKDGKFITKWGTKGKGPG